MSEKQKVQKAIDNAKASMKWYLRGQVDFHIAMKWLDYELSCVGFREVHNADVR